MGAQEQNRQGSALYREGKLEEAKACFEQALAEDKGYFPARLNLGIVLFHQGDLDGSVKHCLKAV